MTADTTRLPSRHELEGAVRQWIDGSLWRHEVHLAETDGIDHFDVAEIDKMGREEARELDGLFRFASGMLAPTQQADINRALAGETPTKLLRTVIDGGAAQIGRAADPNSVAGRLLARTVLRGYATFLQELREGVRPIGSAGHSATPAPIVQPFAFTSHWAEFRAHKIAVRQWKLDTAANADGTRNVFDRIFPGLTVDKLTSEPIALTFKTTLLKMRGNYSRGENATKTIDELIALAANLPEVDRVQPATVNKHLNNAAEYFTYLIAAKKLPEGLKNPFAGLHMQKPAGRDARNERHNWPVPLERKMFESPLYTGCASIHRRSQPGDNIYRDALFWMPILARTMGTRENEICDAYVRQVCFEDTEDGQIAYLDIIAGKDSGSPRNVPFAELSLDMGFLEQRVYGRDPDEPLFPELLPQGYGLRRSAAFTDRFSYYRRGAKIYRPRVDFHSYRGNVETDLKNHKPALSPAWIDELIGHESKFRRSEGDRYTKKIYLPILKGMVDSISIAADLSHLNYAGVRGKPDPSRDRELGMFVALAEKEMAKKRPR